MGAFIPNIFYLILFSIFIYFIFNKQIKFSEFNNIFIKLLLLFWSISVLSSFFSDNKIISLISSISFIRFITFAILTYWLIKNKFINYNLFFKTIIITLSIVLFFAYFEFFTGYNIILDDLSNIIKEGLKQPQTRITSLFGDEQVLGGYLLRILLFSLIIYFALDSKIKNNYKYYFLFLILSCFMFIILSGERSSIFMLIFLFYQSYFLLMDIKKLKLLLLYFF